MDRRSFLSTLWVPFIEPCKQPQFRLLAFSRSRKFILISNVKTKEKLMLDGAEMRILILGKPGEWKDLETHVRCSVKYIIKPSILHGDIVVDGVAEELRVCEDFE